jgi:hypothetical protein
MTQGQDLTPYATGSMTSRDGTAVCYRLLAFRERQRCRKPQSRSYMKSLYGYTASGRSGAWLMTPARVCEYLMVTGSGS